MIGPGRYDDLCTYARERAKAEGCILIVLNGEHGQGFACQATPDVLLKLPELLEDIAKQLRADGRKLLRNDLKTT